MSQECRDLGAGDLVHLSGVDQRAKAQLSKVLLLRDKNWGLDHVAPDEPGSLLLGPLEAVQEGCEYPVGDLRDHLS